MNDSVKKISLDIHSTSSSETVNTKKGDTGRKICISLVDGGIPYTISKDCYAVFTAKKPDGNVLYNDCTIEKNIITYEITEQTTAVEGRVNCEIKLYGADNKLITSPKFTILVYGTVYNEGDEIESTYEVSALTKLIVDASEAVENANDAADKAIRAANGFTIISKEAGNPIHLDGAAEQYLVGLRIFGKTTQEGTPTPDAPVELVSIGDGGSVAVDVVGDYEGQRMVVATPNGLPGIPVASDGNYTDTNGQQWICDEIDLGRGVYVQRVLRATNLTWRNAENDGYPVGNSLIFRTTLVEVIGATDIRHRASLCNKLPNTHDSLNNEVNGFYFSYGTIYARIAGVSNLETFLALMDGAEIITFLDEPIETPLSEEELAAFSNLYTYRGNTTISNDASTHMEIEYVMDAKKYIDGLLEDSPIRVTSVNLPASRWTGSGSLYSQVVSIDGITENSQVNLTPSIEQLSIFYDKNITFVTENDGGVVTVYVIGQRPQNDYMIQADIVEVKA